MDLFQPVDPLDAAASVFEDAVAECTAVTQNALGIRFLALSLHEKVSHLKLIYTVSI